MRQNNSSGNAFLFILIGVALFAALSMTLARSMRSDTATTMSGRKVVLAASEILDYAQHLTRGVDTLRRKGVSESDISFDNDFVAGYDQGQLATNDIFSPQGGRVRWSNPPPGANDGSDWVFSGDTCLEGVGTGTVGCESDGVATNEDLVAVLPNMNQAVCEEINMRLGIDTVPALPGGTYSPEKFAGNFVDGTYLSADSSKGSSCFLKSGDYYFLAVLLAR